MHKFVPLSALAIAVSIAPATQAAGIEVDENTTLSVFGAVELKYNQVSTLDNDDPTDSTTSSTQDLEDNGSVVGIAAEHRFNSGLTAYAASEYEYNVLGDNSDFERDESFFGLRGAFGDIRFGDYDNLFIEAVYDVIDPFETTSLAEEAASPEDSTVAYFSPNFGGFSFEAQTRIDGDRPADSNNSDDKDQAFIGVAKYTADRWALHASFDDRGTDFDANGDSLDPSYGVAAVGSLTDRLGLSARYAIESDANENETAYYGVGAVYDYGLGDLYAAAQEIDPDVGDSRTQFAAGANYFIEENLFAYGEYGDFDQPNAAAGAEDSVVEVGLIYEY